MSDKNKTTADSLDDAERAPQVGALLRASRLRVGEDLRDVSDDLCIRYLYLEAIEECRYADLPGDTYAIGFIRSYAEHLGLDGEEVVRRYRMEQASGKRLSDLSFPTPVPESGVPKGAIVLVGAVLAVLVYGGWYVTTTDETILSDLISPVPERLQHLVEDESKPEEGSETTPSQSASSIASDEETTPAPEERVNSETKEAQQANTAEALAEATEAARDSIADAASETASPGASETSDAPVQETPETPEAATAAAAPVTEMAETTAETVPETVEQGVDAAAGSSTSANVAAEPTESETTAGMTAAEFAARLSAAAQTSNAVQTPDTQVSDTSEASGQSEPETAEATDVTSAAETPTSQVADQVASSEETTTPEASSEAASENPQEPAQPNREVSAEDLNAQALQAATSGDASDVPNNEPAETASEEPTATTPTQVASSGNGIVIRAVDSSWVQITDSSNGEVLFTGLMNPGTTFDVPSRSGLLLDTGNAGAIDIVVNGNTVPKLGGVGDVRKGVALDVPRLIAGTAAN